MKEEIYSIQKMFENFTLLLEWKVMHVKTG
jgi:hypothetical protein